jgi:hypothetical protein
MSKDYGKKCEKVFAKELSLIKDQKIRDFVVKCFEELCPDYFWTVPASTSGRYHPDHSNGKGGLVRHVKAAIWWAEKLLCAFDSDNGEKDTTNKDAVIAALILHDMKKNGDSLDDKKKSGYRITQTHGVSLGHRIFDIVLKKKANKVQSLIIYAVQSHMGVWTRPNEYRPDNIPLPLAYHVAHIVHMADFCAAQKTETLPKEVGYKK